MPGLFDDVPVTEQQDPKSKLSKGENCGDFVAGFLNPHLQTAGLPTLETGGLAIDTPVKMAKTVGSELYRHDQTPFTAKEMSKWDEGTFMVGGTGGTDSHAQVVGYNDKKEKGVISWAKGKPYWEPFEAAERKIRASGWNNWTATNPMSALEKRAQATGAGEDKDQYIRGAVDAAKKHGVDPDIYLAVIQQESGFDPKAKSPTGVRGISQMTLATGKGYGINSEEDRSDPMKMLDAGAAHLADLYREHGNWPAAIQAYNGGSDPNYLMNVGRHLPWSKSQLERIEKQGVQPQQTGPPAQAGSLFVDVPKPGEVPVSGSPEDWEAKYHPQPGNLFADVGKPGEPAPTPAPAPETQPQQVIPAGPPHAPAIPSQQDLMGMVQHATGGETAPFERVQFGQGPKKHYDDSQYETKLSPEKEQQFQQWFEAQHKAGKIMEGDYRFYKENGYGAGYDFRAAFEKGLKPSENGHWSDYGKKPSHETFSVESKYARDPGVEPGRWEGEKFIPFTREIPRDVLKEQERQGQYLGPRVLPKGGIETPVPSPQKPPEKLVSRTLRPDKAPFTTGSEVVGKILAQRPSRQDLEGYGVEVPPDYEQGQGLEEVRRTRDVQALMSGATFGAYRPPAEPYPGEMTGAMTKPVGGDQVGPPQDIPPHPTDPYQQGRTNALFYLGALVPFSKVFQVAGAIEAGGTAAIRSWLGLPAIKTAIADAFVPTGAGLGARVATSGIAGLLTYPTEQAASRIGAMKAGQEPTPPGSPMFMSATAHIANAIGYPDAAEKLEAIGKNMGPAGTAVDLMLLHLAGEGVLGLGRGIADDMRKIQWERNTRMYEEAKAKYEQARAAGEESPGRPKTSGINLRPKSLEEAIDSYEKLKEANAYDQLKSFYKSSKGTSPETRAQKRLFRDARAFVEEFEPGAAEANPELSRAELIQKWRDNVTEIKQAAKAAKQQAKTPPENVTVEVQPAPIDPTDIKAKGDIQKYVLDSIAAGQVGTPEEMAQAYLSSLPPEQVLTPKGLGAIFADTKELNAAKADVGVIQARLGTLDPSVLQENMDKVPAIKSLYDRIQAATVERMTEAHGEMGEQIQELQVKAQKQAAVEAEKARVQAEKDALKAAEAEAKKQPPGGKLKKATPKKEKVTKEVTPEILPTEMEPQPDPEKVTPAKAATIKDADWLNKAKSLVNVEENYPGLKELGQATPMGIRLKGTIKDKPQIFLHEVAHQIDSSFSYGSPQGDAFSDAVKKAIEKSDRYIQRLDVSEAVAEVYSQYKLGGMILYNIDTPEWREVVKLMDDQLTDFTKEKLGEKIPHKSPKQPPTPAPAKEPWEKGWTQRHDPAASMATIPGEPLEVFRDGKATIIETEEGGYVIQRDDGSYVLNKTTNTAAFDNVEDAKKAFYGQAKTDLAPPAKVGEGVKAPPDPGPPSYQFKKGDMVMAKPGSNVPSYLTGKKKISSISKEGLIRLEGDKLWFAPKKFSLQEKAMGEEPPTEAPKEAAPAQMPKVEEYNQSPLLKRMDASVDSIRELTEEKDDPDYKHGYRYEIKVSYPISVGERGYEREYQYKTIPTVDEVAADIQDFKHKIDAENPLRSLGATMTGPKLTPKELHGKVFDENNVVELSNGWQIKRSRVSGENRIEITGPDYAHLDELKNQGVFTEKINWNTRFFIPTGPEGAMTLAQITKARPVISVTPRAGQEGQLDEYLMHSFPGVSTDQLIEYFNRSMQFTFNKLNDFGVRLPTKYLRKQMGKYVPTELQRDGLANFLSFAYFPSHVAETQPAFKPMYDADVNGGKMTAALRYDVYTRMQPYMKELNPIQRAHVDKLIQQLDRIKSAEKRRELDDKVAQRGWEYFKGFKGQPLTDKEAKAAYGIWDAMRFVRQDLTDSLVDHIAEYGEVRGLKVEDARQMAEDVALNIDKTIPGVIDEHFPNVDKSEGLIKLFTKQRDTVQFWLKDRAFYLMPHTRWGPFWLHVYKKDVKGRRYLVYAGAQETTAGLQKMTADAKKKFGDTATYDESRREKIPMEMYNNVNIPGLSAIMELAKEKISSKAGIEAQEQLMEAWQAFWAARGWGGHMIRRSGVPGYEMKNMRRVYADYVEGYVGMRGKMTRARGFTKGWQNFTKREGGTDPVLQRYTLNYTRYLLDHPYEYSRIRRLLYHVYLGASMGFRVLHGLHALQTGWPVLSTVTKGSAMKLAMAHADRYALTLEKMGLIKNARRITPNERRALEVAKHTETIQDSFTREIAAKEGSPMYRYLGKVFYDDPTSWGAWVADKWKNIYYPTESDRWLRESFFLAALRGIDPQFSKRDTLNTEAIKKAIDLTKRAYFRYARGERPPIGRGLGSIWLAFQTWVMNFFKLIHHMATEGQYGGLMRLVLASMAIGGATGGSFWAYPRLKAWYRKTYGKDLNKDIERHSKEMFGENWGTRISDTALYGLPAGLFGFDLSQRMIHHLPFAEESEGRDSWSKKLIGAVGGPFEKLGYAASAWEQGQPGRAAEQLMPNFVANPMKAYRMYKEGATTISGRPIAGEDLKQQRYTFGEAFIKALGGQPLKQSKEMEQAKFMRLMDEDLKTRKTHFSSGMANALKDQQRANKAGDTVAAAKAKVKYDILIADLVKYNKEMQTAGRSGDIITGPSLNASIGERFKPVYPSPRGAKATIQRSQPPRTGE